MANLSINLSKSPGPDSFHPRVLFEIRHEILEPLQRLFTTSYCLGKLPADWHAKGACATRSLRMPALRPPSQALM